MKSSLPVLLLVLFTFRPVFAEDDHTKLRIDPRNSRAQIRLEIVKRTPIGMSSERVLDFIQHHLEHRSGKAVRIEARPAAGPSTSGSGKRGVRSLRILVADYVPIANLFTSPVATPIRMQIIVQWAFDSTGRLIEVFVDRQPQEL